MEESREKREKYCFQLIGLGWASECQSEASIPAGMSPMLLYIFIKCFYLIIFSRYCSSLISKGFQTTIRGINPIRHTSLLIII